MSSTSDPPATDLPVTDLPATDLPSSGSTDTGSADLLRPRRVPPVSLAALFAGDGATTEVPAGTETLTVTGVSADSRLVAPGDLYVAVGGATTHGARFAARAVAAGARAVLTDPAGAAMLADDPAMAGVSVLEVGDPRAMVASLAATLYAEPAARLATLGVTGTNGKTTTAYLLEAALRAAGRRPGLIGTLGYRVDGRALVGARTTVTTPEAAEVQALLATMLERGADSVAMEVSSHALAVGRVDAIRFDVAALTNFGRDHLDFHGTVADYFEAKASLFTAERTRCAVLNTDDPAGVEIADRVRRAADIPLVSTSLDPDGTADYRPVGALAATAAGTELRVRTPTRTFPLTVGLPGEFNVSNALTAIAMLDQLVLGGTGLDLPAAVAGLASVAVPGRMERVWPPDGGRGPAAYVDFAHTPQAVEAALTALAAGRTQGDRLVVVLGCGGDRDPDKREPMGAIAARLADLVVVTDDNPRTEEPAAIRAAVLAGGRAAVAAGARSEVIDGGDRRAAIATAIEAAGVDGVVAVLGKGHEDGQDVNGVVHPFSDRDVLRRALAAAAVRDR